MIHSDYEYQIEMYDPQRGRVLGRQPLEIDWVPIAEAIALDVLRAHGVATTTAGDVRVEPLWNESAGGSRVRGVRATSITSPEITRELSLTFFSLYAQRLSSTFVNSGNLSSGELYEYSIFAHSRSAQTSSPRRLFKVESASPAIVVANAPIRPLMNRALLVGTDDARDLPVFVHWNVMQECAVLTRRAGAMETGGVLIGRICRDEDNSRELFIEITAQIPSPAQGELTKLTFNADTWARVQRIIDERHTDEIWIGWWHSHSYTKFEQREGAEPQAATDEEDGDADAAADGRRSIASPFLSEEDRLLHRVVFPRAYSIAVLITDTPDSGMSWAAFGWRNGAIKPRAFHLIDLPLPREFEPEIFMGDNHATPSHTIERKLQPAATATAAAAAPAAVPR